MSQFLIQDSTLQSIGDAVRNSIGGHLEVPRYVKAYTFPTTTVSKNSGNYNFSNGVFTISTTIQNNLGIDLNELDHWLVYWTSTDLYRYYSTYASAIGIQYGQWTTTWEYSNISHADSFEKYIVVPKDTKNNQVEIVNLNTSKIGYYNTLSFQVDLVVIPVKANGDFFITTDSDTYKWNMPEVYESNDLLPVTKLASIINSIGCKVKIYERLLLVPAENTNYSSDSGVDQLTYSEYYRKPTSINSISQILCIVWADRDYIYYTMPAQDNVNNEAPIYCCRLGNNTWEEYTRYSTKFLFKSDSKYLWVNDNNTNICPDCAAILVYT